MVDYKKATFEDILADAKENKRTDYLKSLGEKKFKDKNGKQRPLSYLQIKRKYFEQYYSEMLPVATKSKKKSIYEVMAEL